MGGLVYSWISCFVIERSPASARWKCIEFKIKEWSKLSNIIIIKVLLISLENSPTYTKSGTESLAEQFIVLYIANQHNSCYHHNNYSHIMVNSMRIYEFVRGTEVSLGYDIVWHYSTLLICILYTSSICACLMTFPPLR